MYHPPYGGGMGGFGGGGMGGYPQAGMPGQWGVGHGGGHREEGHSSSGHSEIDKLVNSNKNQRDAARIEVWVNQVTQVMSKMKLGKPLEDMIVGSQWSVSDPGTESSQAATAKMVHDSPSCSPPDSPPWRHKSEGGNLAPIPAIELSQHAPRVAMQRSAQGGSGPPPPPLRLPGGGGSVIDSEVGSIQQSQTRSNEPNTASNNKSVAMTRAAQGSQPNISAVTKAGVTLGITFGMGNGAGGGLPILRIKDGGVASKDGRLGVGDVVLFVDGTNLEGMRPMEAQKLLVGPAGSSSSLQIHKEGGDGGEPTTIVLRRDVGSNSLGPTAFGIVRKT